MIWKKFDEGFEPDNSDTFLTRKEQVWNTVQKKLNETTVYKKRRRYATLIAACFILGLIAVWLLRDIPTMQMNEPAVALQPKLEKLPTDLEEIVNQLPAIKKPSKQVGNIPKTSSMPFDEPLKHQLVKENNYQDGTSNSDGLETESSVAQIQSNKVSDMPELDFDTILIVHKNEMSRTAGVPNNSTILTKLKLRVESTNPAVGTEDLTIKTLIKTFK